ncbi:MAG TPA: ABC transporter substrate-binding protein [Stellaceae bacterium]|jgi:ABC-type nitrate/sulfonate/bicarbonate transport system substrate-binding protein|nr:ABC transporter substrate-binding protein [Stellaceae bacterium]
MRVQSIVAVAIAAIVLHTASAQADPLKIRMGWVAAPASLVPILFPTDGIAKHNGKSYTVEATHFQGSPLQITALQSGQIDIAALGFSSFSLAVENAGMSDLRIIADEIQWGVEGHGTADFAVLKDSPIKKVEDLKGKVLVTNGIGGGLDMIMKAEMLKHGMIDKRDFSVIEINFPNMKSVLEERKADLIPSTLPWSRNPAQAAITRTLFTTADAMGHVALSFWVAHKGFLDKNHAAMVDFLEDYLRSIHWYLDPKNHDAAVKFVSDFTKVPVATMQGWLFTKADNYRDPNGLTDIDAVSRNIHTQRELGLIKADLDARQYDGLALIKEAAKRVSK